MIYRVRSAREIKIGDPPQFLPFLSSPKYWCELETEENQRGLPSVGITRVPNITVNTSYSVIQVASVGCNLQG